MFLFTARTLLVDTSCLQFQPHLVEDFCEALKNVFSVACNVSGPSRLPLFSMFAMTSYPEVFHNVQDLLENLFYPS